MFIYLYVCMYVYLCINIYIYICIYISVYIHICTFIYVYLNLYLNMYVYKYIYICIYIPLLCFRPHLQPSHNGFNRSTSSALNARAPGDATGFHTAMPAAEDLGRLSLRQQLRYREMFDMIQ